MRRTLPFSERKLNWLCAIRRPLTEAEKREAVKLAKRVRDNAAKRKRYASDPEYRAQCIARALASQGYA